MRDRMERLVVLPFSVGCISDSSVAVLSPLSKPHHHHSPQGIRDQEEENMKNVFKFLAVSKPEISTGINRLFKSLKTISQLIAYKEEESEDGETSGMEIGVPTNVKHVSHIGWESGLTAAAGPGKGWEDLIPPELLAAAVSTKQDEYPEENLKSLESNNIKLFHFGIHGKTDPPTPMPKDTVLSALRVLVDVRNHPILIHCKQGKHRTGCLVGCLRKVQNWCLSSVLEEYQKCAGLKWRQRDLRFIEEFDVLGLRQCLYSIIYQYNGYGLKRRKLLYQEENVVQEQHKPQATKG